MSAADAPGAPLSVIQFERFTVASGRDESPCDACGTGSWDPLAVNAGVHAGVELPELAARAPHPQLERELPKYAIRVDAGHEMRPFAPGIHVVSDCGAFPGQRTGPRRHEPPLADVYIRHYRCMNRRHPKCGAADPARRRWAWWLSV